MCKYAGCYVDVGDGVVIKAENQAKEKQFEAASEYLELARQALAYHYNKAQSFVPTTPKTHSSF